MKHTVHYKASPVLGCFHQSDARRRGVRGPVGSGKSTAMCMELMRRAREQAPGPDGIRRTRFAVVRNTYRELKDTTIKTWTDWFRPEWFGLLTGDLVHHIRDGDVDMEVMFRALDRPDDAKKLLSLELTGGWVNEAREIPFGIIEALDDRVVRYPAVKDGGCTWQGIIMDTNAPDEAHWWYRLAEEEQPTGWEFFNQPGGLIEVKTAKFEPNLEAENLQHLTAAFYATRMEGKGLDHVRVYYCNRYGFVKEGKPVFPEYRDEIHAAAEPIPAVRAWVLHVGLDFGLTPAALFAQKSPVGQWRWIDELVTEDMGAVRFGELLGERLRGEYADFEVNITGDPAGDERAQTDERTVFDILRAAEIPAVPAKTNDPVIRREAVAVPMMRLVDGEPGFRISPKCVVARKGLGGGYCYKRLQVAGAERHHDKPDKNRFSHVVEAGEYAMLGAGEGKALIKRPERARSRQQVDAVTEFEMGL